MTDCILQGVILKSPLKLKWPLIMCYTIMMIALQNDGITVPNVKGCQWLVVLQIPVKVGWHDLSLMLHILYVKTPVFVVYTNILIIVVLKWTACKINHNEQMWHLGHILLCL